GVLLVGSGNLGLHGLADGNEVFCRFDSRTPAERDAIRAWQAWMGHLVVRADDQTLAVRWGTLTQQAPWLAGPAAPSPFAANLERSLLDQLADAAGSGVDELHVAAPFFDPDAAALAALIERLRPRELALYLTGRTNLDGAKALAVIERTGVRTRVFAYGH